MRFHGCTKTIFDPQALDIYKSFQLKYVLWCTNSLNSLPLKVIMIPRQIIKATLNTVASHLYLHLQNNEWQDWISILQFTILNMFKCSMLVQRRMWFLPPKLRCIGIDDKVTKVLRNTWYSVIKIFSLYLSYFQTCYFLSLFIFGKSEE